MKCFMFAFLPSKFLLSDKPDPKSNLVMKTSMYRRIASLAVTTLAAFQAFPESAHAAVYWNGSVSSDWADAANWTNGLPSEPGAGDAIINPGSPFATPVVSTPVPATVGQTYISTGAGLNVASGGQLTTISLVTGIWGNSNVVDVAGGALNITSNLLLGNGGFDGKINISGGSVTANNLSINTGGGAKMNLGGSGSFIAPIANLGNVNYWITNNAITAYDGAPGWSVNIDTESQPGNLILTAIPEPSVSLLAAGAVLGCGLLRSRRSTGARSTNA